MVPTVERDVRTGSLRSMAMAGGNVLDPVHLGPVHAFHELPGIGGEGLYVPALPFCVESVKGQRGFSGPAQACDDRDAVERDVEIEVLEIMLSGTPDSDDRGGLL